ncbi:SMI1/KNR4 family protein, partial [Streptomyces sp. NPDC057193]
DPRPGVPLRHGRTNEQPSRQSHDQQLLLGPLIGETAKPDEWTVLVNEGRGPEWEHHPVSVAAFVAGVLTGRIHSETLGELQDTEHSFDSNSDILGSDE